VHTTVLAGHGHPLIMSHPGSIKHDITSSEGYIGAVFDRRYTATCRVKHKFDGIMRM
jgi:hypothetical protein